MKKFGTWNSQRDEMWLAQLTWLAREGKISGHSGRARHVSHFRKTGLTKHEPRVDSDRRRFRFPQCFQMRAVSRTQNLNR